MSGRRTSLPLPWLPAKFPSIPLVFDGVLCSSLNQRGWPRGCITLLCQAWSVCHTPRARGRANTSWITRTKSAGNFWVLWQKEGEWMLSGPHAASGFLYSLLKCLPFYLIYWARNVIRIKQTKSPTHGVCNLREGVQVIIKMNNPTNRWSKTNKQTLMVSACVLEKHPVNTDSMMWWLGYFLQSCLCLWRGVLGVWMN